LWAATCGHNHIVDYLLGSGGSRLSEKNNSGLTAMLLAALNGKNKTLELLLEKYKVSLVEQDDDGSSALSLAGGQGHVASVQHLLQLGAFIDLPLKNGRTLVQKIKQYQNHAALPLLKAASKLFSIPNNKSSSALNIYLTQRRINKLLHVLKGSVNARRVADGNTALHVAILNENLILAHALVKANAHLLKNNKGETPLDLAKQSKNPQLLTLFTTNTTDTENTTASEIKSSKETQETKPSAPPQHSKDINAVGQDMTRAVTLTPEEYKIHKETQKIVPPAQKPPVPPKRPSILLQYEGLPDAPLAPTATNHSGYPDPILNEPGSSSVPNNPIPKILKRNKFLNQKVAELNKTVLDLNQRILDLERRNQELKEQLERKKTINTSPPLLDTVLDPAEEEGSVVPKQSSSPKRRITNFS
jgi:ankyrin repeat protein